MGLNAFGVSDAAKRLHDTYATHRIAQGMVANGKWFAVRLTDGISDGVLYDTKKDAIRNQIGLEKYYAYVCVTPAHMTHKAAEAFLSGQRKMYDMGHKMTDPDDFFGGREPIKRLTRRDQYHQIRAVTGRGPATNLVLGE